MFVFRLTSSRNADMAPRTRCILVVSVALVAGDTVADILGPSVRSTKASPSPYLVLFSSLFFSSKFAFDYGIPDTHTAALEES